MNDFFCTPAASDEETDSAVPPTAVEPVPSTPAAEQPVAEAVPTTPPLPPTDKQPDVAVTVETVVWLFWFP